MARANTARKPDTELSEAKRLLTALEAGAIRAELIGCNACSALGIIARGHAPVLALCQLLIEAGHDPNRALLAYRGDTLCLRVRSIVEGAALAVADDRLGRPRFRRRRTRGDGAARTSPRFRRRRARGDGAGFARPTGLRHHLAYHPYVWPQ
jgi:hypothetical protein